jgi:carboxylate-amine ligase
MAFPLFSVCGVEIEWMIVHRERLDVAPKADLLLRAAANLDGAVVDPEEDPAWPGGVDLGPIGWSNELTAHVVEFKTAQPAPSLDGLSEHFHAAARQANALLAPMGLMLLPGGVHPWMAPTRETTLWSHAYAEVYQSFHRLFNCYRHGWANLQSCHINLPFDGDAEFARLHAAIRAVLPILPAIAAASPVMDGVVTGMMDSRLETYRTNATRVPEATGIVIPERAFTEAEYGRVIFQPLYAAMNKIEPSGTLSKEFSNARGAIARFSRGAIEIRVIDAQEAPKVDLAIVAATRALVRGLAIGLIGAGPDALMKLEAEPLSRILQTVIKDAEHARITDATYLRALGFPGDSARADELWRHLLGAIDAANAKAPEAAGWYPDGTRATIDAILTKGCLSRRLVQALGPTPTRARQVDVYRRLANCLETNTMFLP